MKSLLIVTLILVTCNGCVWSMKMTVDKNWDGAIEKGVNSRIEIGCTH